MSDLIDRKQAIDGLDVHYIERINLNDWQLGWNAALDWMKDVYLDELPPAQPEPEHTMEEFMYGCEYLKAIQQLSSAQPHSEAEIQKIQDLEQAEIEKAFELGREEGRKEAQPEQRWIPCSDCERKCDKWENLKTSQG